VRQAAWLNAVPEKAKQPRIKSRPDAQLPPLLAADHVIQILFEVGPVKSGGMGAVALSDLDLLAWQANQALDLTTWECRTIIELSRLYAGCSEEYKSPRAGPPWVLPVDRGDVEKLTKASDAMASWLKRMAKKPG